MSPRQVVTAATPQRLPAPQPTIPEARLLIRAISGMNKLEAAFSVSLESQRRTGTVAAWRFEGITLKLAHDTRYTPDFYVLYADGSVTFFETKGFMRDDAHVKIKVAARVFPEFRFVLVQKGVETAIQP